MNWAHELAIPIQESLPILKPVVKIKNRLVNDIIETKEVFDQKLSQDNIEGGLCIKIEYEDRFLEMVKRMLDCFSEQYSRQLVRASLALELCLCLVIIPGINTEVTNVKVKSFCHHRACRNRAIRS